MKQKKNVFEYKAVIFYKAIIIVPRASTESLISAILNDEQSYDIRGLVEPDKNLASLLTCFSERSLDPSKAHDRSHLRMLKLVCECVWARRNEHDTNDTIDRPLIINMAGATGLLQALIRMRDWGFLARAVDMLDGGFNAVFLFAWVRNLLDMNSSVHASENSNAWSLSALQEPLRRILFSTSTLFDMMISVGLMTYRPEPPDYLPTGVTLIGEAEKEWARTLVEARLETLDSMNLGFLDGHLVMGNCIAFCSDEYIRETYASTIPFYLLHSFLGSLLTDLFFP